MLNMKLRYIFATLAAALTLATGCEKEVAEHVLAEVQVSSSYLAFPAQGGSVEVNVKAVDSWTVKDLPEWITSSPSSGSQGESTVKFTATAAEETREASFGIECAGKTQTINAIQVTEAKEVVTLSVAQALEIIKPLGEGQVAPGTYRVRGVVCKIQEISTSYGNATYYLSDDGSFKGSNKNDCNWLQVYRGLWINGAAISRDDQFAVGDEIIIEGALMDYKGTPETKEKTAVVVEHNPSLIKVESTTLLDSASGEGVTEFPKEGGSIMVSLSIKGEGFHVIIPEEAKSWLHIEDFGSDYVTLSADANTAGERSVEVGFSTRSEGVTYNCSQVFTQKGEIAEVSVADFLAAPVGDAQFRITGVVSRAYDSDSQGKSFYLRDWSGETLVFRLDDFSTCGATIGDVITVVGKRGAYKENPQMVSGVYEKHIATVKDKTLAEIAAAADDANVYYIATGTVKEIANETYGNLYLTDDSGDLYVYGCYPGWGASGDNRKNFLAAAGIKVGDKLSVIGVKGTHNGSPQIANGIYFSHEAGEAPSGFDFTPSAEYLSADNLWKAADEGSTVTWFYNPNWEGELAAPETSFNGSTYTVKLNEADNADEWTTQMKIHPAKDFVLDPGSKYTFSCKVYSSTGTNVFIKMYQDGVDWPESFETPAHPNRISVAAGETKEIKVENFIPLDTPQILLIDFAHHGADNTIYVKDIVIKKTGSNAPAGSWDYTPGADYLGATNLWKSKAVGNEMYYYYHCVGADWNGTDTIASDVPFMSFKESTYELSYDDATTQAWQNQFFIFPAEGHFIALDAAKTYKIRLTLGANLVTPAFFKLEKYDAGHAKHEGETIWEYGSTKLDPSTPLVLEHEFTGVSADNVTLVFDFGGNSALTKVYIKDITLLEVGGENPPADEGQSITEILAVEKGAEVKAAESLVSAVTSRGFVATDGSKAVYVYTQGSDFNGIAKIGDKVKFAGSKTVFNGVHEIEKVSALEVVSSGNSVSYPEPKDITASIASYQATEAEYITYTGTLKVSGNYFNVEVDGADASAKMGSVVYPADADAVKALDGKHLRFTGYFNGLSGSGKYVNVITTSIEEVSGGTAVSISIDGSFSDWDAVGTAVTSEAETPVYHTFKVAADDEYIYFYSKRDNRAAIWNSGGYFYYDIDADNNSATGVEKDGIAGLEFWMYIKPFAGTSDAPAIASEYKGECYPSDAPVKENVVFSGANGASYVELETRLPLSTVGVKKGDTIKVYSWSNKDGYDVQKKPVEITI